MKKLSNLLYKWFIVVLLLYIIAQISKIWLPFSSIEYELSDIIPIEFTRYQIYSNKTNLSPPSLVNISKPTMSIDDFTLKAIFAEGNGGMILILDKQQTEFLSYGDTYKGYKLIKINKKSAILYKDGNDYSLSMSEDIDMEFTQNNRDDTEASEAKPSFFVVSKAEINEYVKSPKKIWSNIKIAPHRSGGKIDGYKIYKVNRGSIFDEIGIKKNDIIYKVNNTELSSNKDAIKLYKQFDKLKSVVLYIKRGDKQMELEYEIN